MMFGYFRPIDTITSLVAINRQQPLPCIFPKNLPKILINAQIILIIKSTFDTPFLFLLSFELHKCRLVFGYQF
jgi:hypothetical protein